MAGWIKLYRKIREGPLWNEKPFDKARAWIDIIMSANHEPRKFLLGNEVVEVDRGSFITSEKKLMERWGWSKSKVRSFLRLLESESMIVKKTDRKKTTLEVLNYCIYQDSETTEEPIKDRKRTAKRLRKDTNKNDKELEEGKEVLKLLYGEKVLLTSDEYQKLVDLHGEDATKQMIGILDNWYLTKGKKPNKSDYHTMVGVGWVLKRFKEDQVRQGAKVPKDKQPDKTSGKYENFYL